MQCECYVRELILKLAKLQSLVIRTLTKLFRDFSVCVLMRLQCIIVVLLLLIIIQAVIFLKVPVLSFHVYMIPVIHARYR